MTDSRAQSNVVGVAVLLGLTVVALGAVTASVGSLVETNAAAADANRVASDLAAAVQPVRTTGVRTGSLAFTDGRLDTVERSIRVLDDSGVILERPANALVFEAGAYTTTLLGGAVTLGRGDGGRFVRDPPITADEDVLVVGVPVLDGAVVAGGESERVHLRTRVTHTRRDLGTGTYGVAVETTRPGPWKRFFAAANATLTSRDFDGDGVKSVVARFPGERAGYVVVHRVEVSRRG
ncbi:DUF7289 family protein [Salarchaeum japonicum]|uniref:Type IV pilin n=1 Tax=Salarchaeum japonicum TaxID=555573 RepID=A0AAV3T0N9_9EURY|nr:type IV pilin [Salarchaeum japonicum]